MSLEEFSPPTINQIFHPLLTRLSLFTQGKIKALEVDTNYKENIAIINKFIHSFSDNEASRIIERALGIIELIESNGVSNITIDMEELEGFPANFIGINKNVIGEELEYYKTSLMNMVVVMKIGDDQVSQPVKPNHKKVISKIRGITLFLKGTNVDILKRTSAFCKALEGSGFIDEHDLKLVPKAFSGNGMKRKINWIGQVNELAFLMECLKGEDDSETYIQREDANKYWVRVSECFTINGKEIKVDNIKSNKNPNNSSRQKIKAIVETLD